MTPIDETAGDRSDALAGSESQLPMPPVLTERLAMCQRELSAMRALWKITAETNVHPDADAAIASILRETARVMDVQAADVWLYDAQSDLWTMSYVHRLSPLYVGTRFPTPLIAPAAESIFEGKAAIVEDYGAWVAAHPEARGLLPAEDEKFWSSCTFIVAPLRDSTGVFGILVAVEAIDRRRFTSEDIDFLLLFSEAASIVFANARRHSEIVRLSAELESQVVQRTRELTEANDELGRKSAQLRQAFAATIKVQEQERTRIGEDLHDRSCQLVAAATFELQAARQALEAGSLDLVRDKIEAAKGIVRRLDLENRRAIEGISPTISGRRSLLAALRQEVHGYEARYGGEWHLEVCDADLGLTSRQELAAYRIAQEAFSNAARHAQASTVTLTICREGGRLTMEISDNGVGFDAKARSADPAQHMGLYNMQRRAESVGGSVRINSGGEDSGTTVVFVLPLSGPVPE